MSKRNKKKDAKVAQRAAAIQREQPKARPQVQAKDKGAVATGPARELTFGKQTYLFMGIGFALVMVGLLLMSGGRGTEYSEFDVDEIYSFRRITLAPIVILAGLGVTIFGIFKK